MGRQATNAPLLVGLDMGSTNVKAVVFDPDGRLIALASTPAITHYPRPAWAYYDPDELWNQACQVLRSVTARLDDPRRIASIAVTSVGEAGVPIDREGRPTYHAIAWFDRRTTAQAERLARLLGEETIFAITGLSVQPIFSICKLMWLKEHEPEAWARTVRFLLIADYIAYRLSGVAATDWSLASRTMAFNIRAHDWDDRILSAAGISRDILAPPVPSGTRIGSVTASAAEQTGLPAGAAVAAGGHDHVCGALAAGVVRRGQMLDSMGTAEAIFLPLDEPLADPRLGHEGYTQGAHVAAGKYYVFGGLYTSGASVEWLRDVLGGLDHATAIAEAEHAPVGSLGACFLPHLRLANAPHPDARARAAFVGLTSDVTRKELVRAVLEGLAYEARATTEPLLAHAGLTAMPEISVIGGSTRNDLLLRIKASVMQATLKVLEVEEATALGAAMLGGLGAGVYAGLQDALARVHVPSRPIVPDLTDAAFYDRYFREVYAGLYESLRAVHHRIHALVLGEAQGDPRAAPSS
jgi:xylulokinase